MTPTVEEVKEVADVCGARQCRDMVKFTNEQLQAFAQHFIEEGRKEQRESNWINPNDKTQNRYLPNIGEKCLFSHNGITYCGRHTGGSFQTGRGVTARDFCTWECVWMYLPCAESSIRNNTGE